MSDAEIDEDLYDSDQEVAKHHSKLIEDVTRLDKRQRVKKAERSEPSLEVSEYHLVKGSAADNNVIRTHDLIKSLDQKGDQSNIIKKLRYIQQKNKVLPKPLEKPAAERIKRTVGYGNVKEELQKWDSIVSRNRTAEQLSFPLKRVTEIKNSSASKIPEFLRGFSTKSDLMKKIEEVDSTFLCPANEEEKKDDKYKMTLKEVILRRKEAARFRAQQSYKEAKAHRQRKIKSKKFHRIQRKDKIKQQLKDFEKLKESDPQEALAKLEQLDRTRAEERMSLRHKNTGQWARNKQIKAKYNKETRQVLAEQLAISRELTQKVKRTDSDEDDDESEENEIILKNKESDVKTNVEIDNFIQQCRQFYDKKQETETREETNKDKISKIETTPEKEKEKCHNEIEKILQANDTKSKLRANKKNDITYANINNTKNKSLKRKKNNEDITSDCADATKKDNDKKLKLQNVSKTFDSKESKKKKSKLKPKVQEVKTTCKTNKKVKKQEEENEDYSPSLEFENPKHKPILDSPLEETTCGKNTQKASNRTSLQNKLNSTSQESIGINQDIEIDPKKYLNIKPKHLKTQLPDVTTAGDDDSEQEEETHKIMSEAFADDDVVEEFRKEKEEEMKKSQPQEIDLSLPGWGTWGGPNIKKRKLARKKSRFTLIVPKAPPRKPENQGKVIVFEHDNEKLKKHLVKELPYPFTRVKDFEASVRAPISRTFVPMNVHLRLIRPTVKTKLGQVIDPMDENELVKKQQVVKKLLKPTFKRTAVKTDKKKNRLKSNDNKER
ncbi:hypothetical protein PUN28_016570 [Cardiocondyla obscurior]|uniref:U3 small nucleolar RNA-associated protein 14 homolog A n=1 Tax=Cardiocondyla obscurior TaxID=286306 RepID=A0AAW2EPH7_9HYME